MPAKPYDRPASPYEPVLPKPLGPQPVEQGNYAQTPAGLTRGLREVEDDVERAVPYAQYQYVDVIFSATANADTDIRHDLLPPTPDDVDYQVVGIDFSSAPAAAPVIYRELTATARPWGAGYLILRCNVASVVATLLLTVRR